MTIETSSHVSEGLSIAASHLHGSVNSSDARTELVPAAAHDRGVIRAASAAAQDSPAIRIWVLGEFRIAIHGVDVPATRNMPRVPWRLLKCLVAHGNRPTAQERFEEILWPDSDGDAAYRTLLTTSCRLRRLLGHKEALLFRNCRLALNPELCWVDAWQFELEASNVRDLGALARSCALYRGPFLGGACTNPAEMGAREQLRRKYLRAVLLVGEDLERTRRAELAAALYKEALEVEPDAQCVRQRLRGA